MEAPGKAPLRLSRRGQAVVEFALVLPVFLLLLFGAVEIGRAYFTLHLLTNAAREGARVGSMPGNGSSDVATAITDFLQEAGLNTSALTTTSKLIKQDTSEDPAPWSSTDAEQGDRVWVRVTYDFQVLSGSLVPGFQGTVALNSTCVFRHE